MHLTVVSTNMYQKKLQEMLDCMTGPCSITKIWKIHLRSQYSPTIYQQMKYKKTWNKIYSLYLFCSKKSNGPNWRICWRYDSLLYSKQSFSRGLLKWIFPVNISSKIIDERKIEQINTYSHTQTKQNQKLPWHMVYCVPSYS